MIIRGKFGNLQPIYLKIIYDMKPMARFITSVSMEFPPTRKNEKLHS